MGIVIRQASLASLSSYIGAIIGFLNVSLFMNRIFSYDQFGLRSVLIEIAVVAAMTAQLGAGRSLVRFFPFFYNKKTKNDNGLFTISLAVAFIGFCIFSIILLLLRENITDYFVSSSPLIVDYYWAVFPLTFLMLFNTMLENKLQSNSNISLASFLKEVLNKLMITFLLIFFYYDLITFFQFILYFILTYCLNTIVLIFYLIKNDLIAWRVNWKFFNNKLRKIYIRYSFFSIFTNMSGILLVKLDTIMLLVLMNLSSAGIYANAMYLSIMMTIPAYAVVRISFPLLADFYRRKDMNSIAVLYKKSSINQFLVGGILFVLLWNSIDYIFQFQKEAYAEGKWVVFILCFARLIDMLTGVNTQIINVSRHYPFEGITSTLLAITAVYTNYLLIPIFGLIGAAMATAISLIIFNFSRLIYIYKKMNIQPFDFQTIKGIFIIISGFLVGYLLPEVGNKFIDIIYQSSVLAVIFIFLIIRLGVSEDISLLFQKHISDRFFKK